ncbi:hypothetical protein ACR4XJ_08410 [Nitratidesulfovibrio sp. D1]|uniref:hypothetical protein n=1 Tax=unclassified Nitratidesulfovibrio TaxID=2802296 RepID=UPI002FD9417E
MNPRVLVALRKFLKIADHTPGRLRLKVDLAVLRHPAAAQLRALTPETWPGLRGTRFDVFTSTLTLDYDPGVLPGELFEELLATADEDRAALLAERLCGATSA